MAEIQANLREKRENLEKVAAQKKLFVESRTLTIRFFSTFLGCPGREIQTI